MYILLLCTYLYTYYTIYIFVCVHYVHIIQHVNILPYVNNYAITYEISFGENRNYRAREINDIKFTAHTIARHLSNYLYRRNFNSDTLATTKFRYLAKPKFC